MTANQDAYEYGHTVVGAVLTAVQAAYEYGHNNIGIAVPAPAAGYEYAHYGDVNTATPTPYIWTIRPSAARPLDGVEIVGFGFGEDQADHDGTVDVNQLGTWVSAAVTDWVRVAATADAYTADRVISPDRIDPEHEVISVTVPSWAVPPSVSFRVETDD